MPKFKQDLKTFSGDSFNPLEAYKGEPILVLFYSTSCLGCTGRALPLAYKLSQENPNVKLVVVHVQFASMPFTQQEIMDIFTESKAPFPIYLDEDAINYHHFSAEGTPHWLLFDKNGKITHSIFGSQEGAQNRLLYALAELTPF
ncbi:MAG: TlpA disulfide reductase family protein [Chitinophagales bacterium]|nr:TlpA family protein disulfide reductase [Chitinophagales bacterium]